jgi:hypothetical protein
MSDDLVQRVALRDKAVQRYQLNRHAYRDVVDAALAVALEEAARVCERRFMGDHNREDMEARRCAAAIRAMIPQEDK